MISFPKGRPLALLSAILLAGCSSCRTPPPPQRVFLMSLARDHRMELTETPEGAIRLRGKGTELVFNPGTRRFAFNGTVLYLNAPVLPQPQPHVADQDVLSVIRPLLKPRDCVPRRAMRRVVIDPGHGGSDSGALAPQPKLQEKDVVLDIARRVHKHVAAAGLEVHMTRDGDQALSLGERAQKSNALKADIFVSIHANSAGNKSAVGIETFVIPAAGFASTTGTVSAQVHPGNTFDAASLVLGHEVHRKMIADTGALDRGVKRARFSVIRNVRCPGILVETGFLSNATEAGRLNDPAYREQVARAIAKGIVAYGRLSRRGGSEG
jgi:N-acetylmuramoyl-L-alanine amidase